MNIRMAIAPNKTAVKETVVALTTPLWVCVVFSSEEGDEEPSEELRPPVVEEEVGTDGPVVGVVKLEVVEGLDVVVVVEWEVVVPFVTMVLLPLYPSRGEMMIAGELTKPEKVTSSK